MLILLVYFLLLFYLFNFFYIEFNESMLLNYFLLLFFIIIYISLKNKVKVWHLLKLLKIYIVFRFLFRSIFYMINEYMYICLYKKSLILNIQLKLKLLFSTIFFKFNYLEKYLVSILIYLMIFQLYYEFYKLPNEFNINFFNNILFDDSLLFA